MTVTIFLAALLGPMALGVPIAFALIITGVALMMYLGLYDAQIVAHLVDYLKTQGADPTISRKAMARMVQPEKEVTVVLGAKP